MGDKLEDESEVLFRQVHPTFYESGQPSSQPFKPTPKDDNKLSVDRSSITTAEASYALYTKHGYASAAVYGVSVGEFAVEEVACESDPLEAGESRPANPAHSIANYQGITTHSQKNIAKRLKLAALARGRLHPRSE